MEIIVYKMKACPKCLMLSKILQHLHIQPTQELFLEDVGLEECDKLGIYGFPTLIVKNGDKQKRLEGMITPKDVQQAILEVE